MSNLLKTACQQALRDFISESSNENKLELHLAYDAIEDTDKEAVLGIEFDRILARILRQNDHPDSFLAGLGAFINVED